MKRTEQLEERPEIFEITAAVRHRVPQIMSIYGVTFSGKTYGALMLAAGLVEEGGKIGFIDTENGRGSMYADDPDVRRVIPQGYQVIELDPPFHPRRYIAALRAFQEAGMDLVITDSGSHAWEGEGGCQDIKEVDKHWANAKLWNKRFSAALRYSPMHHIVCLRAQEKTKIVTGDRGKQEYIPLGILPICEKSFPFDLGLAFSVDGEIDGKLATHLATPVKWPKAMNGLFGQWTPQLLTPGIGRRIREWNESGAPSDTAALLRKQARSVANEGIAPYEKFFRGLSKANKEILVASDHASNKAIAQAITDRSAVELTQDSGAEGLLAVEAKTFAKLTDAEREKFFASAETKIRSLRVDGEALLDQFYEFREGKRDFTSYQDLCRMVEANEEGFDTQPEGKEVTV